MSINNNLTKNNLLEIAKILKYNNIQMATAESCTGGLIAANATEIAGSSAWFWGGAVTYSNHSKIHLGVSEELINNYGAVSEQVASSMSSNLRSISGCKAIISVTGIAGPGGGSINKPVGTVCFGFILNNKAYSCTKLFTGNREEIRNKSVDYATSELLNLLKEYN